MMKKNIINLLMILFISYFAFGIENHIIIENLPNARDNNNPFGKPALLKSTLVEDTTTTTEGNSVILYQCYPNPVCNCGATFIKFYLPDEMAVTLDLFDIAGNYICNLVKDVVYTKGEHGYTFDVSKLYLLSGVYEYRLIAGKSVQAKRVTVLN